MEGFTEWEGQTEGTKCKNVKYVAEGFNFLKKIDMKSKKPRKEPLLPGVWGIYGSLKNWAVSYNMLQKIKRKEKPRPFISPAPPFFIDRRKGRKKTESEDKE